MEISIRIFGFQYHDKKSRVRISTPLIWSGIFNAMYEKGRCCIHTSSQKALVWGGVLDYIIYPGASTINLSFWLNWFLDMVQKPNILIISSYNFNASLWISASIWFVLCEIIWAYSVGFALVGLQEMSPIVIQGNDQVTGHIISTTIGGKNGELKQVRNKNDSCQLWITAKIG